MDLFARLVDRVFYFLNLYLADHIEAVIGCHFFYLGKKLSTADCADQTR
jgi:hypothetical protein